METVRMDKFLWSVRLYKTRQTAAEACEKGHVSVSGQPCKASRSVRADDVISVRKTPVTYTYRVKELTDHRVSAPLVAQFIEDMTPASETEKLVITRFGAFGVRDRGTGRPTKKDRRDLDDFLGELE